MTTTPAPPPAIQTAVRRNPWLTGIAWLFGALIGIGVLMFIVGADEQSVATTWNPGRGLGYIVAGTYMTISGISLFIGWLFASAISWQIRARR